MAEARFSSLATVRQEYCPTCEHRGKFASCRPYSIMDDGKWVCLMVAKLPEAEDDEEVRDDDER